MIENKSALIYATAEERRARPQKNSRNLTNVDPTRYCEGGKRLVNGGIRFGTGMGSVRALSSRIRAGGSLSGAVWFEELDIVFSTSPSNIEGAG